MATLTLHSPNGHNFRLSTGEGFSAVTAKYVGVLPGLDGVLRPTFKDSFGNYGVALRVKHPEAWANRHGYGR